VKLLVYGINHAPELTGIGKYTGEMVSWFSGSGIQTKVVTAPPYYPNWRVFDGYLSNRYQIEIIGSVEVVRCPLYVPKKPTTITRLLHLLSFSITSWFALLKHVIWRPDVIVVVEPSLFCAPATLLLGLVTGAKTVLHIQDYEIDAMFGLGMMRRGIFSKLAFGAERWIMRRFDRVSTISYSMLDRAKMKGVEAEKMLFFPNWVDINFIHPNVNGAAYRIKWEIAETQKLVLYSGNIGKKQGLEIVLETAQLFKDDSRVQFVIVGQGAHRLELECLAKEQKLSNFHFRDLVAYEDLPELMAAADIHLVVQKRGAADAVLPSKLASILSAGGHSLITAEKDTELGFLVEKHPGIAERVDPENLDDFVRGLKVLLEQDTKVANETARNYAVEFLSRDSVLPRFSRDIHELCGFSRDEYESL